MAALAFYNSVKMGTKMNVPAAKQVYEDLKKRFEAQGQRREETPETVWSKHHHVSSVTRPGTPRLFLCSMLFSC